MTAGPLVCSLLCGLRGLSVCQSGAPPMRPISASRQLSELRWLCDRPRAPTDPWAAWTSYRARLEAHRTLGTLGPPPTYLRTHRPEGTKGPKAEGGGLLRSTTHRHWGAAGPKPHSDPPVTLKISIDKLRRRALRCASAAIGKTAPGLHTHVGRVNSHLSPSVCQLSRTSPPS
jgi:hypothetical protein